MYPVDPICVTPLEQCGFVSACADPVKVTAMAAAASTAALSVFTLATLLGQDFVVVGRRRDGAEPPGAPVQRVRAVRPHFLLVVFAVVAARELGAADLDTGVDVV